MITEEECDRIGLLKMLAAFVDGEGTISIGKSLLSNGKYSYYQQLIVSNSDVRLIDWTVDNFGGTFPKAQKLTDNRKDTYKWTLSSYKSYKMIKKIRPYLILKQEQADCAIELYEKVTKRHYHGSNPMPDYKRKLAEELFQRCKELKIIGKYTDDELEVLVPLKIRKDVLDEWLG
ncbi:hypothetical protein KAX02_08160 [candidate division WOR-3 bacterium]|nr:hypothetical protein [candidate division WOR-3 bacterium]